MKVILTLLCFAFCAVFARDVRTSRIDKLEPKHRLFGIQGGKQIHVQQSPYVVAIIGPNKQLMGSGAIINKQWIVTAGIAVYGLRPQDALVRIGSDSATTGGNLATVEEIVLHPGYKGTWKYDVALVKLSSPLTVSAKTKPIAVGSSLPHAGENTLVTGYGPTTYTFQYDGILRQATVPFIPYSKCASHYKETEPAFSSLNFCAGKDGVGACPLDWGAPLVYKNKLIGIFSGSDGNCGSSTYPGAYADLTQYAKWIKKTIGH